MQERLATLEANLGQALRKDIPELCQAIKDLGTRIESMRPSPWQLITALSSMTAVVLVIVGMVGKVAVFDPVQKLDERVSKLESRDLPASIAITQARQELILESLREIRKHVIIGAPPKEPKQ